MPRNIPLNTPATTNRRTWINEFAQGKKTHDRARRERAKLNRCTSFSARIHASKNVHIVLNVSCASDKSMEKLGFYMSLAWQYSSERPQ